MGFKERFQIMTDFFARDRIDHDVDFLTAVEHQPRIIAHLESLGFETLHRERDTRG